MQKLDGLAAYHWALDGIRDNMTNHSDVTTDAAVVDDGANALIRAPGCIAAFVGFILIITIPDMIPWRVPSVVLAAVAIVLGVGCVTIFRRAMASRWGITSPDVVQLLGHDLGGIRRLRLDDYRLVLPKPTSPRDRLLHEALYSLKWIGHLLIFSGLGFVLYRIMVIAGIAS